MMKMVSDRIFCLMDILDKDVIFRLSMIFQEPFTLTLQKPRMLQIQGVQG